MAVKTVVSSKLTSTSDGSGSSSTTWHAACFRCRTCQQLLVDLAYCCKAGSVYCERHYAELVRPRCRGCDEVSSSSSLRQGRIYGGGAGGPGPRPPTNRGPSTKLFIFFSFVICVSLGFYSLPLSDPK